MTLINFDEKLYSNIGSVILDNSKRVNEKIHLILTQLQSYT